ncbi:FRG domain-containing protein [Collimonas sp. H4R21]|uniref:FRG domain-containing protein n=1 Tax=Collimonas rhizosphaerae TaxID=3126357 RepID=A0ABU9PXR7_9BURK
MKGQWFGEFQNPTMKGFLRIDVDETTSGFAGRAVAFGPVELTPTIVGSFDTLSQSNPIQFSVPLGPADPNTGFFMAWDDVAPRYPGTKFAKTLQVTASWDAQHLTLKWVSDIGNEGQAVLSRTTAGTESEYVQNPITWDEFKRMVAGLEPRRFVFRGQSDQKRLRTTYHRTGRADLTRYAYQDIPALHQYLSSRTRHFFNLQDPKEYGAFLHLAQHHGYPTPLLDWSFSPYVASFFAYRSSRNSQAAVAEETQRVRIYKFDKQAWQETYAEETKLDALKLHISAYEFLAIDNERMIPQQAMSILTNIDDIERYIRTRENDGTRKYLEVFDLSIRDRPSIMRELSMMGVTAGSLFPGLDGSCEELKERFF